MPITIPRTRVSARTGQRARTVVTDVEAQVVAQGFQNAIRLSEQALNVFHQAAVSKAEHKVEVAQRQFEADLDNKFRTQTDAQNLQTLETLNADWESNYDKAVSEARSGLLIKGDFDRNAQFNKDLNRIRTRSFARKTKFDVDQKALVTANEEDIQAGDYDEVIRRVAQNPVHFKGGLGAQYIAKAQDGMNAKIVDSFVNIAVTGKTKDEKTGMPRSRTEAEAMAFIASVPTGKGGFVEEKHRNAAKSRVKAVFSMQKEMKSQLIKETTNNWYSKANDGSLLPIDIDQINADAQAGKISQRDRNSLVKSLEQGREFDKPESETAMDKVLVDLGDAVIDQDEALQLLRDNTPGLTRGTALEYEKAIIEEFNTSQDKAMSLNSKFARTQIITIQESLFDQLLEVVNKDPDEVKREDAKIELKSKKQQFKEENRRLHQYNIAMRDWRREQVRAGKSPTPQEIEKEGMRKLYSEFSNQTNEPLEELDAVIMVSPEGKRFNVPKDKIAVFEKNKYTRE